MEGEISWSDDPVLAKNNQDRIAINHVRTKSFADKSVQLVVMWLKNIDKTFNILLRMLCAKIIKRSLASGCGMLQTYSLTIEVEISMIKVRDGVHFFLS